MMKKILILLGFISLNISLFAQSDSTIIDTTGFNQTVIDTTINQEILLGYCDIEGLKNFSGTTESFHKEYDTYELHTEFIKEYQDSLFEMNIIIIMGSWCGDSKREVPRFYKILEDVNFPVEKITLICVDRSKKAGNINLEDYYVELVPTFIFMRGKIEKGRIIEAPYETLEGDIGQIISQ